MKQLHRLWAELMRKKPDTMSLESIMMKVPELKEKAAKEMLKQRLTRHQLFLIMMRVSTYAERAGRRLLIEIGNLSHYDLVLIMQHAPRLRRRVWKQFCNANPTSDVLRDALYRLPEFRKRIIRILLARDIDEYTLLVVLRHAGSKVVAKRVAERILNSPTVSRFGLLGIVEHARGVLQKRAAEKMLQAPISAEDLFVIMKYVPSLRMDAWEKLGAKYQQGGTLQIAQRVLKEIPALRSHAKKVLRTSHFLVQEMINLSRR